MNNNVSQGLHKALHVLRTGKFWWELLIMTVGIFIAAVAVYYFLVPSKLIIGTISGLSIVLSTIAQNVWGLNLNVGMMIFLINAFLLVLAYFLIGSEFGLKTVYTALLLGPLTNLLDAVAPWQTFAQPGTTSVMGDIWFDLLCFVLILSLSQAMLFRINCSTGGLDILAKIVNKYFHFDMGNSVTVAGGLICCTAFFINPFNMVIIGLIGTWINGIVINYFSASFNNHKRVCIISKDYEKIRQYILHELHRGCTLYEVIGGYSNERSIELDVLLSNDEFAKLMAFIESNQVQAFMTAGNVSEVYGTWNNNRRRRRKELAERR